MLHLEYNAQLKSLNTFQVSFDLNTVRVLLL